MGIKFKVQKSVISNQKSGICSLFSYNLSLFFVFCFLFFVVHPAHAASPKGSIEASPVFTEVVLEQPEETKKIVFTYKNNSNIPVNLEIFPIDFRQADRTGAINFLGAETGSFSYSLASFLSFESNTVQLDPGQKKDFIVTVSNREDLSPGGHYAAVIAKLTNGVASSGQAQIAPSVSSLILLRKVGGERFNISLSEMNFPPGPVVFSYPNTITALFRNEGNTHLVPFGIAEVKDLFGRLIYKGIINTASLRVFPETRRYIQIDMQSMSWSWPISFNTIVVKGEDSLHKTKFSYNDSFLYVNPIFVGILILIIPTIVVVYRRFLVKRLKRSKKK